MLRSPHLLPLPTERRSGTAIHSHVDPARRRPCAQLPFCFFGANGSTSATLCTPGERTTETQARRIRRGHVFHTNRDEPGGRLPCGVVLGAASTSPAALHGFQHAPFAMVPSTCVPRAVANSSFHVHVEERIEHLRTQNRSKTDRADTNRPNRIARASIATPHATAALAHGKTLAQKGRVGVGRIGRCAIRREERGLGSARQGSTT